VKTEWISSEVLLRIKSRLRQARISWAIFAGAAASCYGSKREITDIDILLKCEDLEEAKNALKGISMERVDFGCGAEIDTPQGKCSFYLDDKMIERIRWRQLFGVRVPVMSVEDNIVLKAILQRGKEKGKHDLEDIETMVSHQKIDVKYLTERIRICHAEKRVNSLLRSIILELS
jgi:hypothetical protein